MSDNPEQAKLLAAIASATPLPRHLKPREVQPVPTFSVENFEQTLAENLRRTSLDKVRSAHRECHFYDLKEFCDATGADPTKLWAWIIR